MSGVYAVAFYNTRTGEKDAKEVVAGSRRQAEHRARAAIRDFWSYESLAHTRHWETRSITFLREAA